LAAFQSLSNERGRRSKLTERVRLEASEAEHDRAFDDRAPVRSWLRYGRRLPSLCPLPSSALSFFRLRQLTRLMSTKTAAADLATKPPSWFVHLPTPKMTPAGMSVDDLRMALQAEEEGSKQPPAGRHRGAFCRP
jgi:hypothetical protein